jgi:DNA-binding transcriptional regulator LsrR (DeoR family)
MRRATSSALRTQEEIAREFGLSRRKVQRLLERARWSGVVDIRIAAPPG